VVIPHMSLYPLHGGFKPCLSFTIARPGCHGCHLSFPALLPSPPHKLALMAAACETSEPSARPRQAGGSLEDLDCERVQQRPT
jgi:hypothetical protein